MSRRCRIVPVLCIASLLLVPACARKTQEPEPPSRISEMESPESGTRADLFEHELPPAEEGPLAEEPAPEPAPPAPRPASRPSRTPEPRAADREEYTPPPREVVTRNEPAPEPPPPATVTIPAGEVMGVAFTERISSKDSNVGDTFRAKLTGDLVADGRVLVPAGSTVNGRVTEVERYRGGGARIGFDFDSIVTPSGATIPIQASAAEDKEGRSKKRKAGTTAGGAAGGALLGQIIGKNTEATVIGAVVGGAIAGGIAYGKKGNVTIEPGTEVDIQLDAPLELPIPTGP